VTKPSADHTQNTEGTAGKGALPAAAGEHKSARSGDTQSAIASIVKGLPKGTHLTAGEVYEKAKELGLDVSLSTVYRTLHRLKTHGDVSTVSGERGVRYEIHEEGENHDHLICLGCGLTVEFVDDLIRGFGKTVAHRKGFEHKSSRFDILGYCETCSSNDLTNKAQHSAELLLGAIDNAEVAIEVMKQAFELIQARKSAKAAPAVQSAIDKLQQALDDCQNSIKLIK
jgi:Fur family ferric uptake transcriptional regulator